ncbi:MAG: hypothetical protein US83_C0006G0043 [Candidatus Falkowbacteria bacterium GW2011_GWC2_38_22]|uniref:DUF916 domain-containing protein n=1 Tax=Candidatus Falkowbacteria bacterium GW2011_GWE1_38_31 TaxID=1618638 RepID=A0A0G0MBL1_9BACT|nr:MAG: hypothetical protein US73_C0001G0046 [Candidatus Falkowbacteria bacterium GW2011_GWF2_38_1205]KKQ61403.1 MAG: hypothetical protein US83_C0006G0043 [Candidatus Falkowbacteria bacterium GW2011_GWC2_38_22]KKQ64014.1 MAG: hypothetical protein US84_C0002G0046 [Candidatus Falkowbacteria bacterium GW2011_GWF1_38_22]KKQ66638.1 MAG: hypothetical protein US87_C0001G0159 [Candidatus Falkowbacteria bacterium GW2011_GWE2_38_254]KKQ71119.1 MAG: hypothetical protein US91_C0001G0046 [Candidatus Falkowb
MFAKRIKMIIIVILFFSCFRLVQAEEGGIVISPYVIDEKAKASEQIERMIKIKNNTEFKVDLYPMVNDVSSEGGKQEFIDPGKLDKSTSLARWIRIQRGAIQLMPGEETEMPFKIEVNASAVPGKRYAIVSFPAGANTEVAAENLKKNNTTSLLINLEIEDVSVEKAQLITFEAERTTFFKWPVKFNASLKNTGTVDLAPKGTISIFNRRGQYLEKIDVNPENINILSGETKDFYITWDKNRGIGKFKAKLELEYGDKEKHDLADTVYFWILPLPFVLFFIGGLFISVSVLVYYLFRRTYIHHQHKHEDEEEDVVINLRKLE